MPDLTLDEADHCPYCGAILRDSPACCPAMAEEARQAGELDPRLCPEEGEDEP